MVSAPPQKQKCTKSREHRHAQHDNPAASHQTVLALVWSHVATQKRHRGRGMRNVLRCIFHRRDMMTAAASFWNSQHLVHRENPERKPQTQYEPQ